MSTTPEPHERVCVRCGEAAGRERFCPSCGTNLAAVPDLPTRQEWEFRQRMMPSRRRPDPPSPPDPSQSWREPVAPVPPPPEIQYPRTAPPPEFRQPPAPPPLPAAPPVPAGPPAPAAQEGRLIPYWWVATTPLAAVCVVILIYASDAISWISNVNSFLGGGGISSALAAGDARRSMDSTLVVYYVVEIIAGICFMFWFRVAYGKLQRAGGHLRFSRGWSIGAWFVPIMSLYRPKQIANDLWQASDGLGSQQASGFGPTAFGRPVSPVVHWWWGLNIAGGLVWGLGVVLSRYAGSPGDTLLHVLTTERTGFYISLVGAAMVIGAAILAVMFMWQVTQGYDNRPVRPRGMW